MAQLKITLDDRGLKRFRKAVKALGESKAKKAYARALTRTNARAFTQVKRTLPEQVGLNKTTQKDFVAMAGLRKVDASGGRLEARIVSTGSALNLKEFGAKQFSWGVSASPWGEKQRFEGAFIFAGRWNSGKPVKDGNVYKRLTAESRPLRPLWGPAIPKEMVRGASKAAWENAAHTLDERIEHEIKQLTKGVVS
ncbi:hypothetical protein L1787_17880 [Acuticoccus sp. M5D2P5]|uniref:hypothetical protein n=1 Tax=Acuticoccus kalidii TaxID=2910977 RepID=UPI001F1E3447|nr:hypothetical protein [Acuticoccus kalidii]MCF3935273.1 hypothetical protein [Acuticoccus kalidii]